MRNDKSSIWRVRALLIALVLAFLGVVWRGYETNLQSSNQIEAKIILSYVSSLQLAHFSDQGSFVAIESWYGAPEGGRGRCERPEAAKKLGFELESCRRFLRTGSIEDSPRYVYRVVLLEQSSKEASQFRAEARSGSGADRVDLVCGSQAVSDAWEMGPDKKLRHVKNCE